MKKSAFFRLFFSKHEKSYFAPIWCKNWYVSVFLSFFEVYFILSRMALESDLKKIKNKIRRIFSSKLIFKSDIDFDFRKVKKSDFFRLFFWKYEKSCFAQRLCKSWLVLLFWSFFYFSLIFSRMALESDLKN